MNVFSDRNYYQVNSKVSEDILLKKSVAKSTKFLKSVIKHTNYAIAILDNKLNYLMVSDQWLTDYNLTRSCIIQTNYLKTFLEQSCYITAIYQECLLQGSSKKIRQKITNYYGITKQFEISIYPWHNEQQQIIGLIIFSKLLNSQPTTSAEKLLLNNQEPISIESFFDLSLDLLCITNLSGYFQKINPAFTKVLGYCSSEIIEYPFLDFVHPEDKALTIAEMTKLHTEINSIKFENRYRCQNGSYRRLEWTAILPENQDLIYAVAKDITESYKLQKQLFWQSKHDCLTGLLNRQECEQQITKAINSAQLNKEQSVFCFLDLDRFQVINDICGHEVGDKLLCQIASLLQEEITENNTLFRLGGDEFAILLKQCTLKQAEKIAHQIRENIQNWHFNWQDHHFVLGVSIGIVIVNQKSTDFSHILSTANAACTAAKQEGRNWVKVYEVDDQELTKKQEEQHWISKLNQALKENRFCLYCQKITPLTKNKSGDHYEILLRLFDKNHNLISPMEFLPAAERYDLMPTIDRWVVSNFFSSYQKYFQQQNLVSTNNTIYTINLSGASINSDRFLSFLKQQFLNYKIPPHKICFEITETIAIKNLQKAANFIKELKIIGCSFALDDFGSGMSSLTYLKQLPVDYLKIDGNFVKNIIHDPVDRTTVECFNRIGKIMNIQTIAEFVENEDIMAQLKQIGINYAQGYGVGRPAPLFFH